MNGFVQGCAEFWHRFSGQIRHGSIHFPKLNLSDLSTTKGTVDEFLLREKRLDVIWHNAGVMLPDNPGQATVQGYHQQLGINVVAPFLIQHYLTPLMLTTAKSAEPYSVQVIFVSSSGHRVAPMPDGVSWNDMDLLKSDKVGLRNEMCQYGQSKAMNVMQAYEFAYRYATFEWFFGPVLWELQKLNRLQRLK